MTDDICFVLRHCQRPPDLAKLMDDAAAEIEKLRAQVKRHREGRPYIIGFNDGYEAAEENGFVAEYHDPENGAETQN